MKIHKLTSAIKFVGNAACAVTLIWLLGDSPSSRTVAAGSDDGNTRRRAFLEEFLADKEAPIRAEPVVIPTATGRLQGYLARTATQESLPALLLIPDDVGTNEWMKTSARELAGIGYEVLVVDLRESRLWFAKQTLVTPAPVPDERILSDLSAALRWLRRRSDVVPERIGVAGWGRGGAQALTLASAFPVQACVICDAAVSADRAALAGLRGTAVLCVQPHKSVDATLGQALTKHKSVTYQGAEKGFMDPGKAAAFHKETADKAWVEIYNFLGKHVEDAPLRTQPLFQTTATEKPSATIFDIMLAVNASSGVRGTLMRDLEKEPVDGARWDRVRANAALIAEAGKLLAARRPAKGSHTHWLDQATVYTTTAEAIAKAATKRDYATCRRGLQELGKRCALCHEQHR